VGNITHLAAAYFLNRSDASATHVPYQGSAPAIQDFLGGQLDFMFDPLPSATPYVQSRRYKALAVTSAKRSSVLPDVPSLQELGYGPFDIRSWFGIFAPAGTPEAIVVKLNHELNAIFAEPAVKDKLKRLGYDSEPNTSDAFDSFVKEEIERWHVIVDQVGAKAD
jgi:tripartite-type tricarboxylate transporter receptor subunit TctC